MNEFGPNMHAFGEKDLEKSAVPTAEKVETTEDDMGETYNGAILEHGINDVAGLDVFEFKNHPDGEVTIHALMDQNGRAVIGKEADDLVANNQFTLKLTQLQDRAYTASIVSMEPKGTENAPESTQE